MLCFPNCKINLGLCVTKKRDDGYHDLETVFYPLPFNDVLEIIPATQTTLHLSGIAVAGNTTDNLVWKAYTMLKNRFSDKVQPFDIYLHKVIPMGAGLGGGSANGAFMLNLLNDCCDLQLDNQALAEMALQLGSDCPFFIYNSPQFASGRGELMNATSIDLSAYSIQLICPEVHVSTRDAFGAIQPKAAPIDLRKLNEIPVAEWKTLVSNDFEIPVFAQHPVLSDIKMQLYNQGAIYASMSGSGSSIYGIFSKGNKATINTTATIRDIYIP